MNPIIPDEPTLDDVSRELMSAMTSLQMPTPETASPHDVAHAYAHLEAVMLMLHQIQHGAINAKVEFDASRPLPAQFEPAPYALPEPLPDLTKWPAVLEVNGRMLYPAVFEIDAGPRREVVQMRGWRAERDVLDSIIRDFHNELAGRIFNEGLVDQARRMIREKLLLLHSMKSRAVMRDQDAE